MVRSALSGMIAITIACASRAAHAEPASGPRREARVIAEQGDAHFYAGRCDKAVALWKKADAIFHAPTLMLRVARCQAMMGKVVDAAMTLDVVASEPHSRDAPAAFLSAKESAKQELKRVSARIAVIRLAVRVSGGAAGPVPVAIDVDGSPTSASPILASPTARAELRVDPGTRRVRLSAGATSYEREIHLDDGEARPLDVALWVEPPRPPASQRALGLGLLGGGVTTLVVGIGLSLAAAATACATQPCKDDPGSADRVRNYTKAGVITIAGGVALTAAGAFFFAVDLRPARAKVTASPAGITLVAER